MLRGENVAADDVLRASRTADLLTRRLRLDRRDPQLPSLASTCAVARRRVADEPPPGPPEPERRLCEGGRVSNPEQRTGEAAQSSSPPSTERGAST